MPEIQNSLNGMLQFAGPLMLSILISLWWLWGKSAQPLVLLPAEANLLIPAPWSRRRLVLFKIVCAQPAILLSTLMMTFILRTSPAALIYRLPALYVMFATLYLHQMGASFVHAAVKDQGRAAWRRMWPAVLIFSGVLFVVVYTIREVIRIARSNIEFEAMSAPIAAVFQHPAQRIAFALPAALVAPALGGPHVVRALLVAVALLAVHVVWVISMDSAFEEGAVEAGAKRAAVMEAMREGGLARVAMQQRKTLRKPWFGLTSSGDPVVAVCWKNVLFFTRNFSPAYILLILIVPAVVTLLDMQSTHSSLRVSLRSGATVLLVLGGAWTLFGPIIMRNDLRMDLRRVEILKSLPIGGTRLIAAEILASASVVTAFQVLFLGGAVLLFYVAGVLHRPLFALLLIVPAAFFVAAANMILIVILNGFAMMFPAWATIGADRPGGVEHLGQNILTMAGTVILFVLSLIPALLVGIAGGGMMFMTMGNLAIAPAVLLLVAALLVEAGFAAFVLSRFYDELDPVEAGLCR